MAATPATKQQQCPRYNFAAILCQSLHLNGTIYRFWSAPGDQRKFCCVLGILLFHCDAERGIYGLRAKRCTDLRCDRLNRRSQERVLLSGVHAPSVLHITQLG